jgi:hypothetical protein
MHNDNLISSLSVGFDNAKFGTGSFHIKNTPVVPLEGQPIRFHWEQYIENKSIVALLEEFESNEMFIVHIPIVEFTQEEVITHIALLSEEDYKRHYGKLKA